MFRLPVVGNLTENYGYYGDVENPRYFHYGIDFGATAGSDIFSMADGRVVFASSGTQADGNGYGYTIIIQHQDEAGNLVDRFSAYSHLQNPPLIAAGVPVTAGQHIGDVGSSGGPYDDHLHLTVLGGLQAVGLIRADGTLAPSTNLYEMIRDHALQIGTFGVDAGTPTYLPGDPPYYGNIDNPGTIFGDLSGPLNDWILPIAGNDVINGGSGLDTVEYQEGIDRIWFYRVDASTTISLVTSANAPIQADILYSVERLADNGASNVIDITSAELQTLFVGSSNTSTRYVVPTQEYRNIEIDGGGGQDTVVVWGVRSDWQVVDVAGPGYWLTANSTSPTSGLRAAAADSSASGPFTIQIMDVENVEFSDGTYSVTDLVGGVNGPDLTVGSVGLGSSGASPGSDIEVSFDIANIGNQSTSATRGEIILSSSPDFSGSVRVLGSFSLAALDASGGPYSLRHYTETLTLPIDLGRSNYYVGVRVDTANFIAEANEDNNLASSPPLAVGGGLSGEPDLRVNISSFPDGYVGSIGSSVTVNFRVSADSDGSIPYTYRVYFSTDETLGADDAILYEATTPRGLGSNGVHYYSLDLQVPVSAPNGVGYFFVQADPENVMVEQREDNNVRLESILISPDLPDEDALPDLFSQRVHIRNADTLQPSTTIYAGQSFNYATDFGNYSPDDAVPDVRLPDGDYVFQNALVLSVDAIISPDDRVIHFENWYAFAPGEYRTTNSSNTLALPSDIASGTYYMAVVTDYYNAVSEEIETNNVSLIQQIEIINNIPVSITTVDDAITLVNMSTADGNVFSNDLYELFSTPVVDRVNGSELLIGTTILLSSGATIHMNADGSYIVNAGSVLGSMLVGSTVTELVTYRATGVNGDVSIATAEITITRGDPDTGTSGNDQINGTEWNDLMRGRAGHDSISGFDGSDTLFGGFGFDTLNGGSGNDTLDGEANSDRLYGGDGNDRLVGDQGYDNLYGDAGNDTLLGGTEADRLYGGTGDDLLRAGTNFGLTVDGLFGEDGNDTMFGDGGFDFLDGGAGNDVMDGGAQADNLYGRAGDDILIGGDGLDRLFGGADNDHASGGEGNDGLFGEQGDDTLNGNAGNDRFFGGTGNDLIDGGDDNDTINGGAGFDTITGGTGDDLMFGRFNADTFVFVDGHGNDTVGDFNALNNFERIDLTGISTINSLADLNLGSTSSGAATQVGANVLIDTGGGNLITLNSVNLSDLDASDFIF